MQCICMEFKYQNHPTWCILSKYFFLSVLLFLCVCFFALHKIYQSLPNEYFNGLYHVKILVKLGKNWLTVKIKLLKCGQFNSTQTRRRITKTTLKFMLYRVLHTYYRQLYRQLPSTHCLLSYKVWRELAQQKQVKYLPNLCNSFACTILE